MTTTEKNKRIEEVEKKMEELRKELSEIREAPTTDYYSFDKWIKSAKRRDADVFYYQIPTAVFNPPIRNTFTLYLKQLMFSYCYDNNWFTEVHQNEEFPRTNPGYYIIYNEKKKRFEESGTNPCFSNPLTVYFSSHEIAKRCAEWFNVGGEVADML